MLISKQSIGKALLLFVTYQGKVGAQTTITSIPGLREELDVRPAAGVGYVVNRALMVNQSGAMEAVLGSPGDCVRVDGTSGPCSSGTSTAFVDAEQLAGPFDGAKKTFVLSTQPTPPESLQLFRNGIVLKNGSDYSLTGNSITFVNVATPQPNDTVQAYYRTINTAPRGIKASPPAEPVDNALIFEIARASMELQSISANIRTAAPTQAVEQLHRSPQLSVSQAPIGVESKGEFQSMRMLKESLARTSAPGQRPALSSDNDSTVADDRERGPAAKVLERMKDNRPMEQTDRGTTKPAVNLQSMELLGRALDGHPTPTKPHAAKRSSGAR